MSAGMIVKNRPRTGSVTPPSSKSEAHRALICAALSEGRSTIICRGVSDDIRATAGCLSALLKEVRIDGDIITVGEPVTTAVPARADCGESGSTLRFLLPLCGALGLDAVFEGHGRLPSRPLAPLDSLLREHGTTITREGSFIRVSGRLAPGDYPIPGDVSSQFISGLLFALPLLDGDSRIEVTGKTESAGQFVPVDRREHVDVQPGNGPADLFFMKVGLRGDHPVCQQDLMKDAEAQLIDPVADAVLFDMRQEFPGIADQRVDPRGELQRK